jgi:hypothetical protein
LKKRKIITGLLLVLLISLALSFVFVKPSITGAHVIDFGIQKVNFNNFIFAGIIVTCMLIAVTNYGAIAWEMRRQQTKGLDNRDSQSVYSDFFGDDKIGQQTSEGAGSIDVHNSEISPVQTEDVVDSIKDDSARNLLVINQMLSLAEIELKDKDSAFSKEHYIKIMKRYIQLRDEHKSLVYSRIRDLYQRRQVIKLLKS